MAKKQEKTAGKALEESVSKRKHTCVRLLKKIIDKYWQPSNEAEKIYIAEAAYVTRTGLYCEEVPYKKVDFKMRLPGVFLGHVKSTNPIVLILRSLFFNSEGLEEIENPTKRKMGCTFCAYQVTDLQGLDTLITRLKTLPELKNLLDEEKKAAATTATALAVIKKEEIKIDPARAACIAAYQEIADMVKVVAVNDEVHAHVDDESSAGEGG